MDAVELSSWVSRYLWPFFRIAGFFAIAPVIGTQLVPTRVKVLFAFSMTILVEPLLPALPKVDALSLTSLVITVQQFLIGVAIGFVLQIFLYVFVLGGQIFAMQTGLGFASMVDPNNGVLVAIISQWYLTFISLVFLAINGHLVMFEVLVDSFYSLPISFSGLHPQSLWDLVNWGTWMFAAGLAVSLPLVLALLIVNLAFGVMTRAAPQLNIFSLGFPIGMLMGVFVMWLSFDTASAQLANLSREAFFFIRDLRPYATNP